MELTEMERESLQNFLRDGGLTRSAVAKFLEERSVSMESSAAGCLRTIPRQLELAADYAAKADCYRSFFGELERFSQR